LVQQQVFAAAMQRLKLRLKFRGSIGVPWRVVNTRPGFDPGVTGTGTVGVLLLSADLEGCDAQAGQG
jgi:hypothetical protein